MSNLRVVSAVAPESTAFGDSFFVTWTVTNDGAEPTLAPFWYDYVLASDDEFFDASDTTLFGTIIGGEGGAQDTPLPIAPGAEYSVTQEIFLSNTTAGNRYLLFLTDGFLNETETDETDNIFAVPISIGSDAPDLFVTSATAPSTAIAGETIALSWTVTNQGTATASADWTDVVYASNDEILDASDTFLTSRFISSQTPLAVGESYTISENFLLQGTTPQTRYLLFAADSFRRQSETNETNNVRAVPISISAPDLTITATAPSTAIAGETIAVSWTVTNQGAVTAPTDWNDAIYASNDEILDASDTFLTSRFISSQTPLAAGESYTISENLLLRGTTPQTRYLLFAADRFQEQDETDETNNVQAVPISLSAPDLVMSAATAPSAAISGETIAVSWTVTNQGTVTASTDWSDVVYASNDEILDASDTSLTSRFIFSQTPLAAGGSYTISENLSLRGTTPQTRYLLFAADRFQEQGETDETNNVRAVPIALSAPDLIVSAATAPATAASAGDSLQISWTVTNQGTIAAPADWSDYIYLSDDDQFDNSDRFISSRFAGSNTPLAAGASYSATQTVTLPNTTVGNRYLLFVADGFREQGETDETNNVRAVPIAFQTGGADLTVSAATAPATATLGANVAVSWTVTNQGTTAASADWFDYIYISDDQTLDGSDTFLTSDSVSTQTPLAANGSYTINRNIALSGTRVGDRYLLFVTDGSGNQGETDETNNVRSVAIRLSAPPIIGTLSAANGSISAALSTTDSLNPTRTGSFSDDYQLTNFTIGERVTLDLSAPFDAYLQLINADTQTVIAQDDDSGPGLDSQLTFIPATGINYIVRATSFSSGATGNYTLSATGNFPDLIVSAATAPNTAVLGETVNLSWTVTNQSANTAVTDWNDYVYLSNDEILDDSDTVLLSEFISTQTPLAGNGSYTINRSVALPETAIGNRYFLFVSDRFNNQLETNETNNTRSVAVTVGAPDLAITAATAPSSAILGTPIDVSWTVTNQGNVAASADWVDRLYLSSDTTLDASDTFITSEFISSQTPLAPNSSYTISRALSLPSTNSNARYLLVVTDQNRVQGETDETNNVRALPLSLTAPDLVVGEITAPIEALSGQPVEIAWTIRNQGTVGATGSWDDEVYLSNDSNPGNDIFVGRFRFTGSIAAGQAIERRQEISIPLDLSGNYRVVVRTNAFGELAEFFANQGNNIAIDDRILQIQQSPVPNLQVTTVTAPPTAFSGQETLVQWTVTNSGTGATNAPFWYDRVYLSLDQTFDDTDIALGIADNPSFLNPGESYTNSLTVRLPQGIDANYYFIVRADAFDSVEELQNENDNLNSGGPTNIDLTPPPDFQVTAVNAPARGFSGQPLTLSWTVKNNGTGRNLENGWSDAVYLSTDTTFDTQDRLLGQFFQSRTLNPGDEYRVTNQVSLPVDAVGDFYLFVRTDVGNQVYENVFESNNTNYDTSPVTVSLTPPPDLVVSSASAPATGEAGKGLRVAWTVTNQGFGDTVTSFWNDRIIASQDEVIGNADDVTLGTFGHFGLLNVDESYSREELVPIPTGLAGQYRIYVVTDATNSVFEATFEDNNTRSILSSVENGNPLPITVLPADKADLQVTQVTAPTTAASGQPLTVSWTVRNQGIERTNSEYWYDRVYLSVDAVLSDDDVRLGGLFHAGAIAPAGEYTETATFTLPQDISGNRYVLIETDDGNQVVESQEQNNVRATAAPVAISLSPTPDLVMQVDAPVSAIAGQPLSLTWTVTNNGAAATNRWFEAFYLSRDQVFDRQSDIFLGYADRVGLGAGESYTETRSFTVPRGLSGRFYVFGVADSGNSVFERSAEQNNVAFDPTSVEVQLAPPADLVVGTVTVPANGVPGQNATISYTVMNQGTNAALGSWNDSIYLSSDAQWDISDTFFGRVLHTGDVAGGASYSETLTAALPGVLPGNYYAIVRSDIRNQIPESNEQNNIGASLNRFELDAERLELGIPDVDSLAAEQSVFYRIDAPAGETLVITFDSSSTAATNELYVSLDKIPTRADFDFASIEPFRADQRIIIPRTEAGTYYVRVFGSDVPEVTASFNVKADLVDFSIFETNYGQGGNSGSVTLRIEGAKFTPETQFFLDNGSNQIATTDLFFEDSSVVYATFNLTNAVLGSYQIKAQAVRSELTPIIRFDDPITEETEVLSAASVGTFQVVESTADDLDIDLTVPSAVRANRPFEVLVTVTNNTLNDIAAPLLRITGTKPIQYTADGNSVFGAGINFLASSSEGPAGVLRPGQTETYRVQTLSPSEEGLIQFEAGVINQSDQPFDARNRLLSLGIDANNPSWSAIFDELVATFGSTWESYSNALSEIATSLSLVGVVERSELGLVTELASILTAATSGLSTSRFFSFDGSSSPSEIATPEKNELQISELSASSILDTISDAIANNIVTPALVTAAKVALNTITNIWLLRGATVAAGHLADFIDYIFPVTSQRNYGVGSSVSEAAKNHTTAQRSHKQAHKEIEPEVKKYIESQIEAGERSIADSSLEDIGINVDRSPRGGGRGPNFYVQGDGINIPLSSPAQILNLSAGFGDMSPNRGAGAKHTGRLLDVEITPIDTDCGEAFQYEATIEYTWRDYYSFFNDRNASGPDAIAYYLEVVAGQADPFATSITIQETVYGTVKSEEEGGDDCDPPPPPGNGDGGETNVVRPVDPNDIIGPAGFGEENWITATAALPYTIRFENQTTATAPAQQVVITQALDPDLDLRTFRVGDFGWGGLFFDVPENRAFYNDRLDLTDTRGYFVDVSAGIDVTKGEAFWIITTIDPETGEIPEDALTGFLPPNNAEGIGDGFVNYSVRAKRDTPTGTRIDAEARIVFDTEAPIDTPPIFNTLDSGKPSSTVSTLPATTDTNDFLVRWSGTDDANGSALATYTIYVSIGGGEFQAWLEDTILTEATYTGQPGRSYAFYSIAKDNAGNAEVAPDVPDAQIRVAGSVSTPGTLAFSAPQFQLNEDGTPTAAVTLTRTNGSNGAVSATINLTDGTATAPNDYPNPPIVVTFADGETSKTVNIPLVNDTQIELNETINLALSDPTGGATLGSQTTATLTVVDDDVQLAFSASEFQVNEDGSAILAVTVNRIGRTTGTVGATVTLTDGTATAASDYTNTPIALTFASGETTQIVTIPIANDTLIELNETLTLTLSNPTGGATLGSQSSATLTVVDDDVQLVFSASEFQVNEDGSVISAITINRVGRTTGTVGATVTLSNGTTTAADYDNTPIPVVFADGELSKTIVVPILNDTISESNETINLQLASPTGGATIGATGTATLTIVDNEPRTETGGTGNDSISGGGGEDTLSGNGGRDSIVGGAGNDLLIGGLDADTLAGGTGRDRFIYTNIREGRDTISDFTPREDQIDLRQLFTGLNLTYGSAISNGYLSFSSQGSNTAFLVDPDGSAGRVRPIALAILQGISTTDLNNANNFLL